MSEVIWSIILVGTGCTGLWLAPRHWWGWAITAASEGLWFAYALTIGAPALAIMACIWFGVNARNAWLMRSDCKIRELRAAYLKARKRNPNAYVLPLTRSEYESRILSRRDV
jgi:hypothetical protein